MAWHWLEDEQMWVKGKKNISDKTKFVKPKKQGTEEIMAGLERSRLWWERKKQMNKLKEPSE